MARHEGLGDLHKAMLGEAGGIKDLAFTEEGRVTGKACRQVKVGGGDGSLDATSPGPIEDTGSGTPGRAKMNTVVSDFLFRTASLSQTKSQTWGACIRKLSSGQNEAN